MKYTVTGIYRNDFKRFSLWTEADDPQLAEFNIVEECSDDIVIAAVFVGWLEKVDDDTNEGRPDERYCYRCGEEAGNKPNPGHRNDCFLYDDH